MRVSQSVGAKGSLKWIQQLVEHHPDLLSAGIRSACDLSAETPIRWVSPVREDEYAEYRDGAFLDRVGAGQLRPQLAQFWPNRGPQWDALATFGEGGVILLEAKAHLAELTSNAGAKDSESISKIDAALRTAKHALGADVNANWHSPYFQYANRLAHAVFLREHAIDARLVFLYVTGDADMQGPATREAWEVHLESVHRSLGLRAVPSFVTNLFVDVSSGSPLLL